MGQLLVCGLLALLAFILINGAFTDASAIVDVQATQPGSEECVSSNSLGSAGHGLSEPGATERTNPILEQILAEDWDGMDSGVLTSSIKKLKERGAHRCWHKHSTFLQHLLGVHNILRLWGQGKLIGRVGLFHSAYSNSYVNLALFDPLDPNEREIVRLLIGEEGENLVHLFCIIDRQQVVVNTLLKQGYIPPEGLTVPHLRNPSEQVFLSPETLRLLLVFTMADIADQYFGWQDNLFGGGGNEGSMILPGADLTERHDTTAIWPGVSKPGLWMSYLSQLGKVARTFVADGENITFPPDERTRDVPPVFRDCSESVSVEDDAAARDLYWAVATGEITNDDDGIAALRQCIRHNPWTFEPLVMLAQKLMHQNNFEEALEVAGRALDLQQQWGTAWDKRLSFGAWVSWTQVLYQRAEDRNPWPTNSWEVNNFGLVR